MEQADLVRRLIEVLERQAVPYMIVGSFASGAYGEPRFTRDVDVVVDLRTDQVAPLCAAFPPSEFYVSVPAAHDAVRRRGQFNLIHPASGQKVASWSRDKMLGDKANCPAASVFRFSPTSPALSPVARM